MIASLPMYDWPEVRKANDAFWKIIAGEIAAAGFDPLDSLNREGEGDEHWLHPDLLFSQTCGYPYATRLSGKVQLLATPCYSVAGCDGPRYSSAIIVRRNAKPNTLEDVLSGTLAFNSRDSLSGHRCFVPLVGDPVSRFGSSIESGGHRKSAMMVARGEADCAAIDAVCWDMFQRFEPHYANQLRVLTWGPSFPALPYITRKDWGEDNLAKLGAALHQAVTSAAQNPVAAALKISSVVPPDEAAYLQLQALS